MKIKMKESFEGGTHILRFTVPPFLTEEETEQAITEGLNDTLVTRRVYGRGSKETQMVNGIEERVIWRHPLHMYESAKARGEHGLLYNDVMVTVNSLADAANGVITRITAIPFDPATGFYLGIETDSGEPVDGFTASPEIQGQLTTGRTINNDRLSILLNRVACDGQPPVWLDDETGDMEDSILAFTEFMDVVCNSETARVWCLNLADLAQLHDAVSQVVAANGDHLDYRWNDERAVSLYSQRVLMSAFNHASDEELELHHHGRTGHSVDDAVFGIKEASFFWNRMSSLRRGKA